MTYCNALGTYLNMFSLFTRDAGMWDVMMLSMHDWSSARWCLNVASDGGVTSMGGGKGL